MSGSDRRVAELEATLNDVLSHIRPQGHPGWEVHTCLVTSEQVAHWRHVAQRANTTADHASEK
ncbi:hypothetical protein ACWEG1_05905 [Streptomyces bauhiniae]